MADEASELADEEKDAVVEWKDVGRIGGNRGTTDGRIRTTQMGMEQRENLGSAMVVGMERGLFTFPNDRLASSGRGRDLLPIEGSFLTRISAV